MKLLITYEFKQIYTTVINIDKQTVTLSYLPIKYEAVSLEKLQLKNQDLSGIIRLTEESISQLIANLADRELSIYNPADLMENDKKIFSKGLLELKQEQIRIFLEAIHRSTGNDAVMRYLHYENFLKAIAKQEIREKQFVKLNQLIKRWRKNGQTTISPAFFLKNITFVQTFIGKKISVQRIDLTD